MENLDLLYEVISDRKKSPKEGSYTTYLFDKGLDKILKKVGIFRNFIHYGNKHY